MKILLPVESGGETFRCVRTRLSKICCTRGRSPRHPESIDLSKRCTLLDLRCRGLRACTTGHRSGLVCDTSPRLLDRRSQRNDSSTAVSACQCHDGRPADGRETNLNREGRLADSSIPQHHQLVQGHFARHCGSGPGKEPFFDDGRQKVLVPERRRREGWVSMFR